MYLYVDQNDQYLSCLYLYWSLVFWLFESEMYFGTVFLSVQPSCEYIYYHILQMSHCQIVFWNLQAQDQTTIYIWNCKLHD